MTKISMKTKMKMESPQALATISTQNKAHFSRSQHQTQINTLEVRLKDSKICQQKINLLQIWVPELIIRVRLKVSMASKQWFLFLPLISDSKELHQKLFNNLDLASMNRKHSSMILLGNLGENKVYLEQQKKGLLSRRN